ncbi:MAG: ligand-binding sensor domain-containing protein, partial [Verrucomicrobiota bacterium]
MSCALARSLPAAVFASESNFAIAVWRTEQGLPQNFIKGVLQAHDGYLWVATFNGLARFDGVRFTVFDVGNTPELRNNLVNRIFEDSQGRLWVGHDNGDIELYAEGNFVRLEVPKEWPTQPIDNIAEDAAGGIWVLNRDGWLLRVDPSLKVEKIFKTDPLGDFLVRDLAGRIWVRKAAPGGCLFQTVDSTAPLATPPLESNARAFASRKGGLWIVEKDRVRRWDKGQWVEERRAFPALDMFHPVLLETRDGSLVAGCFKSGLYILRPDDELQQVTTASGLAHDWVYCLGEDREGNLWVGTGGGGLNMLHARRVKMLNAPDNWLGRAVLSVAPSDNGGLWIATEGAGIYHSQGTEVKPIPQNSNLPTSVFWSVLEKSNQSVWLGSWDEGLFLLSNGVARVTPKGRPIPPEVVCLYTDRHERLWVGTTAGLGCLEGGKWTEYAAGQDLPKPDVRCLTEAADGSIWFGTMGAGLCRIQGNQVDRFTKADGLVNDYVWALWAAPNGDLWIGTC